MLKGLLMKVRWGTELTKEDLDLAKEMSFLEVFKSSYLTPKSIMVKYDKNMKRR